MRQAPPTTDEPRSALDDPSGPRRLAALRALREASTAEREAAAPRCASLLATDPAPLVRRAALRLLLGLAPPRWSEALVALSDPVWRLRSTAVRLLGALGREQPELQATIRRQLSGSPSHREAGARLALEDEWAAGPHEPHPPAPSPASGEGEQSKERPLSTKLERGSDEPRAQGWGEASAGSVGPLPPAEAAQARTGVGPLATTERAARNPRRGWDEDPAVLLEQLRDEDLRAAAPALVELLRLDGGKQLHETLQSIRATAVEGLLEFGGPDEDEEVLLALSEPRYPYLVDGVRQFLRRLPEPRRQGLVARVQRRPWAFAEAARRWASEGTLPQERGPSYFAVRREGERAAPELPAARGAEVRRRTLGEGGPAVAPLGLSGRSGLGSRGYARALEAGVDLLFWEPTYEAMGAFVRALPPGRRRALTVVMGSFEASPAALRRDLERGLRQLGLDAAPVFLLFWVRSAGRLRDEVIEELCRLKTRGWLGQWGLSTHDRGLAVEALERGAQVLMVRHSAAHRGAEGRVFPEALRRGAGVMTFSCTCYGKLLEPSGAGTPPTAPDLYRYALAQPGVTACISAPRTEAELEENLGLLPSPDLSAPEQARLRQHGDAVYLRSRRFFELLRAR